jgi:ferredoxin-type protein NapG
MDKSRRRFFGDVARTAGGAALIGLGLGVYAKKAQSLPAEALRPPGALPEADFVGACVRCGLCVRSCPYDTLKLARFEHAIQTGTPYFTARDIPCEMCEDIPCIEACPTGALDPGVTDIDEARMGIAVLVDQENCLNFLGLRCDVCHRVCPLIDEAITIERQHNARSGRHAFMLPTVHAEACTGCGKCEYACVLPEAAIKVLPQHLARGAGGEHYRLGWEEKQRAGESLVPGDPDHEYHLPEGLDYDYEGDGLIREEPLETPFPDDPLETLNQGANP